MKVVSIMYAGKADVYNMEVEDTHDYAVENGAIVHNCRYFCMARKIQPRVTTVEKILPFDPLDQNKKRTPYSEYVI